VEALNLKIILSGGGTAGHINPAIAIADKIKELYPDADILFIGSKNGMENKLVARAGYPIWSLDTQGIKRSPSLSNFKAIIKALKATAGARKMLESFSPDAVIGTGGYVCYPTLKAASKMGIFTAIHESNSVPGLAVRMLKKRVDKIFVGFEGCKKRLSIGDRCIFIGNPIKSDFITITKEQAREKLDLLGKYRYVIVSFGGSLGAKTVNDIALKTMVNLSSKRSDVLHVHSCGKACSTEFFSEFKRLGLDKCKNIKASEYIYDMPLYLCAADAVICRSGAMTLAEIATAGAPSVLVPSPNVTANHQYENALEYSKVGAAFAVDEKEYGAVDKAFEYVSTLITEPALRKKMSENVRSFACVGCAEQIVNEIIAEIKKER
jgi:UDP-N-acetylglucosamine--N-acetylmuramyl-(pentapeptide) pyrophosphoryl-undecaprenol N-acetylglucosamine transferase